MTKGIIISGQYGDICVREKTGNPIALGELLVAETSEGKILLHVFDLIYGSQLNQQHLELVSGLKLEEDESLQLMDAHLRSYVLAKAKNIILINNNQATLCKSLPPFFTPVRAVCADDLRFFSTPRNALTIGFLRSGTTVLDVPVILDGRQVFSHHILISGTTGKGKSVLMKNLLWETIDKTYCGLLVLDPHDEYYGKTHFGLKDHPASDTVLYYTPRDPPPGCRTLKIHLNHIKPQHFNGVVEWSDPQQEALAAYYRDYGTSWIEAIVTNKPLLHARFAEATIDVVKRRMMYLLSLDVINDTLLCTGIFDTTQGQTTLIDIVHELDRAKKVIINTSELHSAVELLIGSLIAHEILHAHKRIPAHELHQLPVISIVLEEAPRVLGKDVLENGPNIFSTIAREGRKFNVGLTAITQLPSLIPRAILANMNTKIILGTELKQERQALIESAAQDLSSEDRLIASLDKGEAIITSTFVKFSTPITIPLFENKMTTLQNTKKYQSQFSGIKLT